MKSIIPWSRRLLLILLDAICVLAAYLATLLFRFGGKIPTEYWSAFEHAILFILLIYLLINLIFRLYSTLWEHASIEELLYVIGASIVSTIICYIFAVMGMARMPRSIYIAAGLIIILLHGGIRLSYRVLRRLSHSSIFVRNQTSVLVIGAGAAGASVIRQMQETPSLELSPVCLVDDDPEKQGVRLHGVRVAGYTTNIPALVKKYEIEQIIYAIPSADRKDKRRILEICTGTNCELKIIPTMETLLAGKGDIRQMRDVDVGDLLERPVVKLDMEAISGYLEDSTVLVTGGGGSIGSELCRQIAKFRPEKLVIFDIYENNAYELFVDLKHIYGDELDIEVVIGSVRDIPRLDEIFAQYKPDVVFHTAAHKHVPLMEISPVEAVKNNVNGTFNTAKAADIAGVKRFVLISTDKAVNPTNIMGATKYLCELIIQYMNYTSQNTKYVAVRFGNVLGSNGSVIPLFRRQIAAGGPVTVTHKDMKRYFMTIPEAAQLVIQAGSMAKQGEIFLLDMGDPVSIDEFARTFIRLSGYEPDMDIKIVYTGLRAGEKMFEELLQESEVQGESDFPGIMIGKAHAIEAKEIKSRIEYLRKMVEEDPANIRQYMAQVVPTYCAPEELAVKDVLDISMQSETKLSADLNGETTEINLQV